LVTHESTNEIQIYKLFVDLEAFADLSVWI
jgi:hypothetical protein